MSDRDNISKEDSSARDFADLRRAVIATFSSSLARSVARVLLIIFVVDLYGIGSFGYLGEVAATVELLAALACLGLPKTIMAYFERERESARNSANLVSNALGLTMAVGAILSLAMLILWPILFPVNAHIPAYAAAAIFIICSTEMMLTLTRSRRIIKWESIVKGLVKPWGFFILAMGGYFFIIEQHDSEPMAVLIAAYFLSLIISALFACIGMWQILRDGQIAFGKFSIRAMANLAKESVPIAIVDAGSFAFRRIDIIILGIMTGSNVTGIYYLGQQLATVVEKMRHLFEPMAAPILAQTRSTKTIGEYLQKTCRWVFAASLGSAICFALYAQPLMALFDVYFAAAILFMSILLWGEIADGSSGLIELPIIFRNPLIASRNVIIALLIEAISVAIATFHFGILGAAAGFSIGMMMLAALRLYSAQKLYDMRIIDRSYFKPLIAGLLSIAVTLLVRDTLLSIPYIGMIIGILICGGVFLIALQLLGISMKISDNS